MTVRRDSMFKNCIGFLVGFVMILSLLSGCGRTMNYVIENEPRVAGIVVSQTDKYVSINVNEDEDVYNDYPTLLVSLDVEQEDSTTSFDIGDEIAIFYDGVITDNSPGTVETVYAIILRTPANRG